VDEKIKVFLMGKWDKIQSLGSQWTQEQPSLDLRWHSVKTF
jgi:hypothetical protein